MSKNVNSYLTQRQSQMREKSKKRTILQKLIILYTEGSKKAFGIFHQFLDTFLL